MIFQNDGKFYDEHHISNTETAYEHYKGKFDLVIIYCIEATLKATAHLIYNIYYIILRRHSRYWFIHMNPLVIFEMKFSLTFFSFPDGIGEHWCEQVMFNYK